MGLKIKTETEIFLHALKLANMVRILCSRTRQALVSSALYTGLIQWPEATGFPCMMMVLALIALVRNSNSFGDPDYVRKHDRMSGI